MMHYFDYNATTPLHPIAGKVLKEAYSIAWYNSSSLYKEGRQTKELLEKARSDLAHYMGCPAEQVVFNSGATEGNNTIIEEWARVFDRIAISAVEHGSVSKAAERYFPENYDVLPVDDSGVVRLDVLEGWLKEKRIQAVSVMAVNNETGVIQPWQEICALCHQYGVLYHCDASQWLGKLPSRHVFAKCDFVTGCAHKFYGPKGVGFIKVNTNVISYQAFVGGGQENGFRSGTVNYPAIAAMVAVLLEQEKQLSESEIARRLQWRNEFEGALKAHVPGVMIVGESASRMWNAVGVIVPEFDNVRWVLNLEKRGYCVSAGTACASGSKNKINTLLAMGYDDGMASRGLRISSGWETQREDWDQLLQAFCDVWQFFKTETTAVVQI